MKRLMIIALFLFSATSWALPESELGTVYDILDKDASSVNLQYASFLGVDDIMISYIRLGATKGKNGSIVIAPGRGEAGVQYIETAIDLMAAGYSPIFVIDHRGQGYSGRELEDTQKNHISKFENYVDDFNILSVIAAQDPQVDKKNLFVLAHSLGGAIVTSYLENYTSVYKAAVMISPMHMIVTKDGEASTLQQTWQACYIPFGPSCTDYIPDGGPYSAKPFDPKSSLSQARWELTQWIWSMDPTIQVGSPTIKWVRESIKANQDMRKPKNLKKIKTPFLILQAQNDDTVDNKGQNEVCANTKQCTKIQIKKANHRLLYEDDTIRNTVMSTTIQYLDKH